MDLYGSLADRNPKVALAIPVVLEVVFMAFCYNRANSSTFGGIILMLIAIVFGAVIAWMCFGLASASGHGGVISAAMSFVLFILTVAAAMHMPGLNVFAVLQVIMLAVPLLVAFRHSQRSAE